jgi:WXXGXW repeat (2 copies)
MRSMLSIRGLFFALALSGLVMMALPAPSAAQVVISVSFGPPALPVYVQPAIPGPGYIWVPGYWAWDPYWDDYYWVPGTWVVPPAVGLLWTPGYWGWNEGVFIFHRGYWGPVVGFYGGICYGYGYGGYGYEGGYWNHGAFYYNRTVNNITNVHITNVYNKTVINNTTINNVSYNGGTGGTTARATAEEEAAARERHVEPTSAQLEHEHGASTNRALFASQNHGKPSIAATPKPGAFKERGVVSSEKAGAPYNPPPNRGRAHEGEGNAKISSEGGGGSQPHPSSPVHPKDLAPITRPNAPNTGNPKLDQKYQQQQEKLQAKQEQERQKLQQKQDQEHRRLDQQKANEARQQQLEQKHQQQTQQLEQRHNQQTQNLQRKQQPPPPKKSGGPPK